MGRYAADIFPLVCKPPETEEEIKECTRDYDAAGFPGCIGIKQDSYSDTETSPSSVVKHLMNGGVVLNQKGTAVHVLSYEKVR